MVRGIFCTWCCLLAKQRQQAAVRSTGLCHGKWEQGQGAASRDPQDFRASLDKAEQPFECLHWSARAGQFPEGMVQELFVCNPEVNTHPSDLL